FLSYLAFLADPTRYFPIRPSYFDALLEHYGIGRKISGYVTWERYALLLDLAEAVKELLFPFHGTPNVIELQSYMWVVGYLLKRGTPAPQIEPPSRWLDWEQEFKARKQRAIERECIGVKGEQFVYEQEVDKLRKAGRADLAERVRVVSSEGNASYDILSFEPDGRELHIEVKTTVRSPENDNGFWLTEVERSQAEQDAHWVVYRVWNVDSQPHYANLGNVVRDGHPDWTLQVSAWRVVPRR
ncbi:MAG: DUF3883 domain-containing protein, partial [Chloroflexi bacterium]|nr:DUF3883 domain-containing protein [Chloroflexota bacterium]